MRTRMTVGNKERYDRWSILFVCVIAFILVFLLNHFTPMHADDYDYSFSFLTKQRITSLTDVIYSQMQHYMVQNGRISTLGLAQVLLMFNQNTIDLILSTAFVLLGILIAFHAEGSMVEIKWWKLSLIFILLFVFTPAFGQSYLWTNSASIYMFGVIYILLFLVPYRIAWRDFRSGKRHKNSLWYNIGLLIWTFIFGFLSGNSNENMGAGTVLAVLAYMALFLLNKIKIKPWMFSISSVLGFLILLLSPGNQRRLDSAGGINILNIPKRIVLVTAELLDNMGVLLLILLAIILFLTVHYEKANSIMLAVTKIPALCYIYVLGALGSVYSMIVLDFFPRKAWSLCIAFLIIAIFAIEKAIEDYFTKELLGIGQILIIAIIIIFGGVYMNAFFTVKSANHDNDLRLRAISESIQNGVSTVAIPSQSRYCDDQYCVYEQSGELSWDSSDWPNTTIARYYGVQEIVREDNPLNH